MYYPQSNRSYPPCSRMVLATGPLGMKYMCDQLMHDVGNRVEEIKKLVLQNRTVLENLRECFDDPVKTRQYGNSLQHSDALLTLLKEIGVALAFRKLCSEALNDVLQVCVRVGVVSALITSNVLSLSDQQDLLRVCCVDPEKVAPTPLLFWLYTSRMHTIKRPFTVIFLRSYGSFHRY